MSDLLKNPETWSAVVQAITAELLALGWTDEDVRFILNNKNKLAKEIAVLLHNARTGGARSETVKELSPCEIYAPGLIPSWVKEIVEDVEPSDFRVEDLELVSFCEAGELLVSGNTMRERAVTLRGNLGLSDGRRIWVEQHKLTIEIQGKFDIVLPGTVVRDWHGRLHTSCFRWLNGRWMLVWHQLDSRWNSRDRFMRSK